MRQVMIQRSQQQDGRIPMCSDPESLQSRVTASPGCHWESPTTLGPCREESHPGLVVLSPSAGPGEPAWPWHRSRWGFAGSCGTEAREEKRRKELFFPCPVAGTQVSSCCCASATGSDTRDGTRDGNLLSVLCPPRLGTRNCAPCPPRLGQGTAAGSKDTTWILILFIHVSTINLPGCSFPDNRIHYDGNILRRTAA